MSFFSVLHCDLHCLVSWCEQAQEGGLQELLRQLRRRQGIREDEGLRRVPVTGNHRGEDG